jgi:hypothetical protein
METKDATHYRHQLIHKQDEVDAANIKLRLLKESTAEQLSRALIALTERHPPKLEVVEYLLRALVSDLTKD